MRTFKTENLSLAAFLMASSSLEFLHCQSPDGRDISFIFADPEGAGTGLEAEYLKGAKCSAIAYHTSLTAIRRAMDIARQGGAGRRGYEQSR